MGEDRNTLRIVHFASVADRGGQDKISLIGVVPISQHYLLFANLKKPALIEPISTTFYAVLEYVP